MRVVWLLEEMGPALPTAGADLLVGVENDPEFHEINPAGFIPAIRDGYVQPPWPTNSGALKLFAT